MSLRVRMGLAAGVAVAVTVVAITIAAYAGTRSELRGQVDHSLNSLAQPIVERARRPPEQPPRRSDADDRGQSAILSPTAANDGDCDLGLGLDLGGGPSFGGAPGLRQFISRSGRSCQVGGGIRLPVDVRAKAVAAATRGRAFSDLDVSGHDLRVLIVGLPGRGALQVALPLADVNRSLRDQLLLLALIAAGGIALAALLGLLVARTAVAPIERFTRQTEDIAAEPERMIEHERLEVRGNDELARLAHTFNATLDALDASVRAQRNLVADASHELRTPIATIRANIQLMRDDALLSPEDRDALRRDVIEELDELTALVSDVVELARGTKQSGEPGDIRLDWIVGEALDRARRRSPELRFQASLEPTLVRGEGDRIARAVANLLDNASKWSPPGGVVEVGLTGGLLTVRDHGPGFPEEDLPFVFDRFRRAKAARSKPGSGLGLAIVRQAAEAHGGFVQAENAPAGGALLRVSFGPRLGLEPDDEGERLVWAAGASAGEERPQ